MLPQTLSDSGEEESVTPLVSLSDSSDESGEKDSLMPVPPLVKKKNVSNCRYQVDYYMF